MYLEELLLGVSLDSHIGGRVGNAGKDESISDLAVLEERLVGLVDGTGNNLTGAGRTGTSTARVWKVKSLLLSLVENVGVIRALNDLLALRSLEGDLVGGSNSHRSVNGVDLNASERVRAGHTEALLGVAGAENTGSDGRGAHPHGGRSISKVV